MRSISCIILLLLTSSAAADKGPTRETIKARAGAKDAAAKINVYAVDETCFPDLPADSPKGVSRDAMQENGKAVEVSLTTTEDFTKFQTWVTKKYAAKNRTLAFGLVSMGDQDYGHRAWCLQGAALLAQAKLGYVKNEKSARLVWKGDVLEALKKTHYAIRRLVVVYNKTEVLTFIRTEELNANKDPEVSIVLAEYKK